MSMAASGGGTLVGDGGAESGGVGSSVSSVVSSL